MNDSRLTVSSELYDENLLQSDSVNSKSCTKIISLKIIQPFTLNASSLTEVDKDGDLILNRNKREINIEVSLSTEISGVGLQLWRGALLLSDYLLFTKEQNLLNKSVVELGSGVGLTSIVASTFARKVISTDIDRDGILNRIESNIRNNVHFVKSEIEVAALDFCCLDWDECLNNDIARADVIIAADVIYDNELTDAFINTLTKILLSSCKTAFIALEKRYVFTLEDLDTVAPCYEYFLSKLKTSWNEKPMCDWTIKLIDINFPQYLEYERNRHLILWQINS